MPPIRRPARRSFARRLANAAIVATALAMTFSAAPQASAQSAAVAAPAVAAAPSAGKQRPILTFSAVGAPDRALTRADLAAMPRHVIETGTPWQDGRSRFEGVRMSDFLRAMGLDKGAVMITGLDGYAAEFPVEEADRYDVILADRRDGKELSIRDRGPLFVIYNFDAEKGRIGEAQHNRSVWQVVSMRVR